jgi:hypothetical protein
MQYNRATAAIFIIHLLVVAGVQNAAAQEAKGVVLCLAACSKSDKACQDRCVPASVGSKGTACIEKCRRRASEPDLVAKMTRCVNVCLGRSRHPLGSGPHLTGFWSVSA